MSAAKSNLTENLRKRAEDLLAQATEDILPEDIADINQLHHELAVHQAELELQNEELQKTQVSLRKFRDRYIDLFENAPVGYVLLDSSGIIRRTNSTWNAMLGQPDADFCGTPFVETLLEDDARGFLSRFRSLFHNPAEKQMELRIKRNDSEPFNAQITAKRTYDEHAESDTDELMVIVNDVTEHRQA
ncbi:MAG: PAS domain-containing protein, partial [Desulfuromonadaceae bacterium]